MNSASGIGASQELIDCFAKAIDKDDVRVIKVSIVSEQLVETGTWPRSGDLMSDFASLQNYVEDNIPAYLLVRLETTSSEWLAISYVPDIAKVRDKMLYASTQNALKRALGDYRFKDSIFATSKADLTPESYTAHIAHNAAPKPLSARETEMADIRAATGTTAYEGMRSRKSHLDGAGGLKWSAEVEDAVKGLINPSENESELILMGVDPDAEVVILKETRKGLSPEQLSGVIPATEPSYAFYAWPHQNNQEQVTSVVFLYCCPDGCPVKHRMLYSSGVGVFVHQAKQLGVPVVKKAETSDPTELNTDFFMVQLGHVAGGTPVVATERVAFAKPRGPPRRR